MLRHFFCIISFVPWLFSKQPHRHSCMALKDWEYHASAFQCLLNRNFKSLKHNALMSNTYMIEQYLNRAIPKPIQSKNSRTQELKTSRKEMFDKLALDMEVRQCKRLADYIQDQITNCREHLKNNQVHSVSGL